MTTPPTESRARTAGKVTFGIVIMLLALAGFAWLVFFWVGWLHSTIGEDKAPAILIMLTVVAFGSYYGGKVIKRLERIEKRVLEIDDRLREAIKEGRGG